MVRQHLDDPLYKEIYDSYMTSMKKSAAWISRSQGAYTAQRNRVLEAM